MKVICESLGVASAPDPKTVHRWVTLGVRSGGRVVKLRAIKIGMNYRTTRRAWDEFLAQLNAGSPASSNEVQFTG